MSRYKVYGIERYRCGKEEVMAISFETIGNGALAAQFRQALAQVGRNIIDPNMDPEAVRGITIKLKFKPNESGTIETIYACEAKLAGPKKSKTTFLIGQECTDWKDRNVRVWQ